MTTNPDLPPTPAPSSRGASILWPLVVLVIIGCINRLGAWPAFRQQDTSILHWILANNSEVLRGLSQEHQEGKEQKERQSQDATSFRDQINMVLRSVSKLPRGYFTLENMNLAGLDLTSSDLGDMSIENVNFAGAQLANADFSCTDLTHVNFSGAKLSQSRFNYSGCQDHISTKRLQCIQDDLNLVKTAEWPDKPQPDKPQGDMKSKVICLEGNFVGADFANAQIRGDYVSRQSEPNRPCAQLLVLVGDMSGASFNKASLTCVALIHRPTSPGTLGSPDRSGASQRSGNASRNPSAFRFNGISFEEARLNRVALLSGEFRFTQFKRADLRRLFLNIRANHADLDYSMLTEIQCKKENDQACLSVPQGADQKRPPLRLNFLWSTVYTNLQPASQDRFLCTPANDLPAWVEGKMFDSASYWLQQPGKPTQQAGKSTQQAGKSTPTWERLPCLPNHLLSTDQTQK